MFRESVEQEVHCSAYGETVTLLVSRFPGRRSVPTEELLHAVVKQPNDSSK
jgi:hypothetical protein